MRASNLLLFSLTFLTTTTLALPLDINTTPSNPILAPRQTCLDTCGTVCYYSSDVAAAQDEGYSLYFSGSQIHSYPHAFDDREGFTFPVSPPYYEYPILRSFQVYTGGRPGPDRVVFNADNEYAGLVTHTGAIGNNFVECA